MCVLWTPLNYSLHVGSSFRRRSPRALPSEGIKLKRKTGFPRFKFVPLGPLQPITTFPPFTHHSVHLVHSSSKLPTASSVAVFRLLPPACSKAFPSQRNCLAEMRFENGSVGLFLSCALQRLPPLHVPSLSLQSTSQGSPNVELE